MIKSIIALSTILFCSIGHSEEEPIAVEEVVVTASRSEQKVADLPANVAVLTRADIRQGAALTLDDVLRSVPGFRLFRRSSSLVGHPTTQGVSLRGVGASGASRTLVLLDGMPLNDPFGGWVQWGKVPLENIERIEVLRGGGAHLWGNYALSGVIHISTAQPQERRLGISGNLGNRDTRVVNVAAAERIAGFAASLEGGYFDTGGFPVVRSDLRGPIDVEARSENTNLRLQLSRALTENMDLQVQGGVFNEDRGNGTPLTVNDTDGSYIGANLGMRSANGTHWNFSAFGQAQKFRSVFSAQAEERDSERPALDQFDVPGRATGLSVEWRRPVHTRHLLAAGTDLRWISGETNERYRNLTGDFTRRRQSGGDQQVVGFYVQDVFIPRQQWQITLGGRVDWWRSAGASRREWNLETGDLIRDDDFADRTRFVINPKLGVRYALDQKISLRSAIYRSFRTPTPNELFRPFRVRNDITEANEDLKPEQLTGVEAGVDYTTSALSARLTAFWSQVDDAIANVSIGPGAGAVLDPCGFVPEGGSCRQRNNLTATRSRGIEAELTYRYGPLWTGKVNYLYNKSEVEEADLIALEGRRLPQIPEHDLVLQLNYNRPEIVRARVQGRYGGDQFEDGLNSLKLDGYFVLDIAIARPLGKGREIFLQMENLLDETYEVGRSSNGIVTIGTPRLVHGGLRFYFD